MHLIPRSICLTIMAAVPGFSQAAGPHAGSYLKQATITQSGAMLHVEANSPRPLEQTLNALQQKYGWAVDYEDPRYISHLDVVDAPGDAGHSQVPAGGSFSMDFPATTTDEEKTLRLVLDAYNHSQNPGQFELRQNGQGDFYVVGTAAHDDKGGIAQQQVLFDLPVTIPTKERTIAETIKLICQKLAKQSHTAVSLGIYPRNTLEHAPVKVGGAKMPARELLLQCLLSVHRKLYWRLLFDPTSKDYVLNIHSSGAPH